MPQRIRRLDGPEDRSGVALLLGVEADELDGGATLVWSAGRRVAGLAHVRRSGDGARIAHFVVLPPGDSSPGGQIALARMALSTAASFGVGPIELCLDLRDVEHVCQALRLDAPTVTIDRAASRALDLPSRGLDRWERHVFVRGQIIARIGDPVDALRVVARGSVRLVGVDRNGSPREIGQVGPGDLLGDALLAGARGEPTHILAHAAEVDLMVVDRASVEALRHTPEWSDWIQRALARRIAALSGRLLNGVEPQIIAHLGEILIDLFGREPAQRACSLGWLAEQAGVHPQRAKALLEPLWESVRVQGDAVTVHDTARLEQQMAAGLSPAWAAQRRELVLSQPAL